MSSNFVFEADAVRHRRLSGYIRARAAQQGVMRHDGLYYSEHQ